ncbi:Eco57I restriction-modification methylase domain-containing protein [Parabacteroides merdae]|uniref:Eco57I restriction-modification methylase domain-containing protein n=1 Tax=Parabacteroides merdae TaxID=46503 RepID=UPI003CFDFA91
MKKEITKIKKEGATFTPTNLATFLAEKIYSYLPKEDKVWKVCDPACGNGSLLLAMGTLMNEKGVNFSLYGSDNNAEYVKETTEILSQSFSNQSITIEEKDFVEEKYDNLFSTNISSDIFIANPPYVRTQILGEEKSQSISKKFKLSGRVDLYYPFLMNMTASLNEGGIIGVITSNRFLTTKSGSDIRQLLLENYDILEVIDLGDTKLFDAAVLPSIFIGRKNTFNPQIQRAKFTKIYEVTDNFDNKAIECNSIYEVLKKGESNQYVVSNKRYNLTIGYFQQPQEKDGIWQMNTVEEYEWVENIRKKSVGTIGDYFRVKVGVKSCADNIFFNNKWEKDEKPEDIIMRKIISQENITKWNISSDLQEVIYPHAVENGKKIVIDITKYPKTFSYFQKHSEELKKRKYLIKANRNWYEYWVPQNPLLWNKTKIVFADISSTPRFAIDTKGSIVNGNCYWIVAENEDEKDMLYLIAAIANSKLMEKYHDLCFNNKLYNGKRRYLSQYVEKYPIPNINHPSCQKIISLVKEITESLSLSPNDINIYSSQIDELVYEVFN